MLIAPTHQFPRSLYIVFVVTLALTALFTTAVPTAFAADAWAGIRHCQLYEDCRVQSQATGTVEHERCSTSGTNCVLKASWSNGNNLVWRTSYHGGGSQMALISTSLVLQAQSATCFC